MFELESTPGRTCVINGKELLFFSGYSYLGMNHVKEFKELVKEGIDKYGLLFPSSRISNTRLDLYKRFENDLSLYTEMKDTVSFSSGSLAGKTIADILSGYKNILIAPGTHPSIKRNTATRETNENFVDWSQRMAGYITSSDDNEFVIVCDAINILTGEIHDLSFLTSIPANNQLIILIDISHGIGLLFKDGQNIISGLPRAGNIEYIICYSLSKALNLPGGAISCSAHFAGKLRQHPNYTGSTPVSPSFIYAYLNSKNLYATQRQKLFDTLIYLNKRCAAGGVLKNNFPLPVFICNKQNAEEHFYNNGIAISSFGYPYPTSARIDRIVVNALHTKDDIDTLLDAL